MKKVFIFVLFLTIVVLSSCGQEKPSKSLAAFEAQEVVKQYFADDCDFDDLDIRGSQSGDTFNVYQEFTSSRPGYERQFVYKAIVNYLGGDPLEDASWDVTSVIVEDKGTGEQWEYYPE